MLRVCFQKKKSIKQFQYDKSAIKIKDIYGTYILFSTTFIEMPYSIIVQFMCKNKISCDSVFSMYSKFANYAEFFFWIRL